MSIPKLTADLAVIQKLSDLPNATEGLTAEQLKAKFDEAAETIQKWINETFIPAIKAENIPFAATSEIKADNVDRAIHAVYEQIQNAATGAIVNGTVSKEKLAAALMERVFGGRVWVSLDVPTAEETPEREFPVGQIWLRPAFRVENLADSTWSASGCTAVQEGHSMQIIGNQTVAAVSAEQRLTGIGQAGDRVMVVLDVTETDRELTGLTACFNGEAAFDLGSGGVFETQLQAGGMLTVRIDAVWPATSLASGTVRVDNVTVVNPDALLRELEGTRDLQDWESWLREKVPFAEAKSGREMYVQTQSGVWQRFDQEVFPVERGGTGLAEIADGDMLYGKDGGFAKLEKPAEAAFLQFDGGNPMWAAMSTLTEWGYARIATGSYVGTGDARTIVLPVTPKLLVINEMRTNYNYYAAGVFQQGTKQAQTRTGTIVDNPNSSSSYNAGMELVGNTLTTFVSGAYSIENPTPSAWNEKDVTYPWLAIY